MDCRFCRAGFCGKKCATALRIHGGSGCSHSINQIGIPGSEVVPRMPGQYDPFPYRYHGCPKVARNVLEDPSPRRRLMSRGEDVHPVDERILRPRWLCFLNKPNEAGLHGARPMRVDEYVSNARLRPMLNIF